MTNSWDTSVEAAWDKFALNWHQRSENNWENGSRKDILPFLQPYIHSGITILDGGCGSGYGAYKFALAGANVVGIDISSEMIHHAKACYSHPSLTFLKGDLLNVPFHPTPFNMILLVNSLEWVENPLDVIKKLKPLLADNGYICASILGPSAAPRDNSFERLLGKPAICNTMLPWEFNKLMVHEGFQCIKEQGIYGTVPEELRKSLTKKHQQSLCFSWLSLFKKGTES